MLHHLNVDIETYSSVDIRKGGLYKYAQSPDFELLLFGCSLDGEPPVVIDLAGTHDVLPDWLLRSLHDPGTVKHAYNAAFEWYCLSRYFDFSEAHVLEWLSQWRDTMLHGLYCGFPAGLAAAGAALGLPQEKRKLSTGNALIRTFCTPREPSGRDPRTRIQPRDEPEKWRLFREYNAQDVVTEQEIERRLSPWPVPDFIQEQWETDIRINARGVAVDLGLVAGALDCSAQATQELIEEAVRISGLRNPNSVSQLAHWLEAEAGVEVPDLRKETVNRLLNANLQSDSAERMLQIRRELGKTSNKKYAAMAAAAGLDGRVRGLLQFYGASRTGRWAGRLVQVQNLPRTHLQGLDTARSLTAQARLCDLRLCYASVQDTLSQLIRTALIPKPGCVFIDADFSAIEARVLAWLAGEDWVLEVFRTHGRIYEATAAQMFGVPVDHIVKGRPEYDLRQKGKVATLALGYQGGAGALISMGALRMGIPENELPGIVERWRAANKQIVAFWRSAEAAAIQAIQTGRPQALRDLIFHMTGTADLSFLTVQIPSGRKLFYPNPRIAQNQWGRDSITYFGSGQKNKAFGLLETYGGKLAENITQAVARDCLADAIERLERFGYRIVFHVHDEVVIECPREQADLERVCEIMSVPPSWARDLPLAADGWVGDYYTKE